MEFNTQALHTGALHHAVPPDAVTKPASTSQSNDGCAAYRRIWWQSEVRRRRD